MSERLFAIGDIHGCFDQFSELVEDKIRLSKDDRLILLGDYIDRGNKIREVVDYILDLQGQGFDVIPLIGNHEAMLLEAAEDESAMYTWLINGAYETLKSFGVESPGELNARYLEFFRNLKYYYRVDRFIFVHAGFNDEAQDPFEDRYPMIWSRNEEYSNPVFNGKTIIHGHTPITFSYCDKLVKSGSRILNIDTGCVYDQTGGYGHLTAIDLYTRELFSV